MTRIGISTRLRFEVFKRDQFTCQYCGREAPDVKLEVDHLVAVAQGGTNQMHNLVTACGDCNSGKGKYGIRLYRCGTCDQLVKGVVCPGCVLSQEEAKAFAVEEFFGNL